MLVGIGCTPDTAAITESGTEKESEDSTVITTEPEETEEPVVMVEINEYLTMPQFTKTAEAHSLTLDLNRILKNGYGAKSLTEDVFLSIFPKVILFNADGVNPFAFRLGERVEMEYAAISCEDGFYVPARAAADIFGGKYAFSDGVYTLDICGCTLSSDGSTAELTNKDGVKAEVSFKTAKSGEDTELFVNANSLADMTGLVLYKTDSGILIYSLGEALNSVKGYYVAEEAEKLYLETAEEIATFSANMFVDIPNIRYTSSKGVTAYTYPAIDLNASVGAYALQGVRPSVTLGPAIVAGQGESSKNSTVVRIFDTYQTLHTQFRAYPADVTGGVQVACGYGDGIFAILTAPYKSTEVRELKVFDANGAYLFSVKPEGDAPYAIAAGAFTGGEDCFAITSMYGKGDTVYYYSAKDGSYVGKTETGLSLSGRLLLSTNHGDGAEGLIISVLSDTTEAYEIAGSDVAEIEIGDSAYNGVYSSAYGGYIATSDATDEYEAFSTVTVYKDGAETLLDAGHRENMFYSNKAENRSDTYVTKGHFWHTRMEFMYSKAFKDAKKGNTVSIRSNSYEDFTVGLGEAPAKYNSQYNMWEPCATHRWNKIPNTDALINYINPDSGEYEYAALNRNGERMDYAELNSSFFNASYAPYVQAMDRLRVWTLRSYLNGLATYYKKSPETTVAVSPVHEHEIDTGANSIGDYSANMIEAFREYLMDMYGSLEAINKEFKTKFASVDEIDPPRNISRGMWDKYSNGKRINDYLTVWEIFNRTVVSQRIVEAYKEAILAGFPPELIKAHQIPEGDAVSGLLGEANTRVSPVDVVLNLGTAYGGTRYGTWYGSEKTFYAYAVNSGHRNITLGEYSAMSTKAEESYNQLKYMFDSGLVFTHVLNWEGNVANGREMDINEKAAIDRLQALNVPRSASSGGVGDAHEYRADDGTLYNIVEIGTKDSTPGLLKSIKEDGTHEGSVYLQPFHAHVSTLDIFSSSASGTGKAEIDVTGRVSLNEREIVGINHGDTVDIRINLDSAGGKLTFRVYNGKYEMEELNVTMKVKEAGEYRFEFKNQLYLEDCSITVEYENVGNITIDAVLMYELTARRYYGELYPASHEGGVSFDLLED